MRYVALLRGVNVGGRSKIDMKELKGVFETAGLISVRTYINSGNVIFSADDVDRAELTRALEAALLARFGFPVSMVIRDLNEIRAIVEALPDEWANDETNKCDVFFLWAEVDDPSILGRLPFDPAIDDVRYTPGAVVRLVSRKNAPKSKLPRIVGTPLYQQITIRNCNTARKLLQLMQQ